MAFHRNERVCVISLDGVPGSLVEEAFASGRLAPLGALWAQGAAVPLRSTIPPISSVAWATYATGVGPGTHGIYGFVDRDPWTMRERLPTSWDLAAPTLWDRLGRVGGRAAVVNLPLTYPARPIAGWLVAGFPAPDLARAAYPEALARDLVKGGYVVDPDPALVAEPERFFAEARRSLDCQRRVALRLVREDWNLFHFHIMVTDRVNHFFFRSRKPDGPQHRGFWAAYERVAEAVSEVVDALPEGTELLLLSDHGFADARWEVDLNAHLVEAGLLQLGDAGAGLSRVKPGSAAYSLTPGRVYLLRRGRERDGWIAPDDGDRWLARVETALRELKVPDGAPAVADVLAGADVYRGPRASLGPDLVVLPVPGVELRGRWDGGPVFRPSPRQGGHTLDGAFLWIRGREAQPGTILDVPPTVWALLGLPIPGEFEGQPLVRP
jgi:predicted AlkP superfamily phosphohydrolase/phosphomutase